MAGKGTLILFLGIELSSVNIVKREEGWYRGNLSPLLVRGLFVLSDVNNT